MKHLVGNGILKKQVRKTDITVIIPLRVNLLGNDNKINPNIQQVEERRYDMSESFSEASKMPLDALSPSQQYNLSNPKKDLTGANFMTLGKISEEGRLEIIKTGFQLQAEGKISLKKYYESTQKYSLFQSKGYNIKSDTIRKNNKGTSSSSNKEKFSAFESFEKLILELLPD